VGKYCKLGEVCKDVTDWFVDEKPKYQCSANPLSGAGSLGYCPSFYGSSTNLGNLSGHPCSYSCWGKGTKYNKCATGKIQFCLWSGYVSSCQKAL